MNNFYFNVYFIILHPGLVRVFHSLSQSLSKDSQLLLLISQACSKTAKVFWNGECSDSDVQKVLACARTREDWEEDKDNKEECIKDAAGKEYALKNCLDDAGYKVLDKE